MYRESADVFNMLVSVYGSKDLFVKEYQKLLAERLRTNAWGKHVSLIKIKNLQIFFVFLVAF